MSYTIQFTTLDDRPSVKFLCPGCEVWGHIDDDQYHGRVSIQCDCGFHETVDLDSVCCNPA